MAPFLWWFFYWSFWLLIWALGMFFYSLLQEYRFILITLVQAISSLSVMLAVETMRYYLLSCEGHVQNDLKINIWNWAMIIQTFLWGRLLFVWWVVYLAWLFSDALVGLFWKGMQIRQPRRHRAMDWNIRSWMVHWAGISLQHLQMISQALATAKEHFTGSLMFTVRTCIASL